MMCLKFEKIWDFVRSLLRSMRYYRVRDDNVRETGIFVRTPEK